MSASVAMNASGYLSSFFSGLNNLVPSFFFFFVLSISAIIRFGLTICTQHRPFVHANNVRFVEHIHIVSWCEGEL